jgi:hypothetical protein
MAAGKEATLDIMQLDSITGTAKTITGATAKVVANTKVNKATIALASAVAGDVVTINDVDFTMAAATDTSKKEFKDAAGLVSCINDGTYGVEGVTASVNSTTVTVEADLFAGYTVTAEKTEVSGTVTLATVDAQAFVEIIVDALDSALDYIYIQPKVTTDANTVVSVAILGAEGRFSPEQAVAASAVV